MASSATPTKYEEYFKNENFYKNGYFNMNKGLSNLKYCVKCRENMDYSSSSNKIITSSEGKKLLYISMRKYLMHCSGGCTWTCDKIKFCPRCGNDIDNKKDCQCNKLATDDEIYLWNNLIKDLLNDEPYLKSLKKNQEQ